MPLAEHGLPRPAPCRRAMRCPEGLKGYRFKAVRDKDRHEDEVGCRYIWANCVLALGGGGLSFMASQWFSGSALCQGDDIFHYVSCWIITGRLADLAWASAPGRGAQKEHLPGAKNFSIRLLSKASLLHLKQNWHSLLCVGHCHSNSD